MSDSMCSVPHLLFAASHDASEERGTLSQRVLLSKTVSREYLKICPVLDIQAQHIYAAPNQVIRDQEVTLPYHISKPWGAVT